MSPPDDHAERPLVEGDHSQLWLRQRRLQVKPKPETADDSTCTCRSASVPPGTIDSSEILAGQREVQIVHAGETYRLLVTRNNKLILQK